MKPEAQRIAIAEACGWSLLTWMDKKGRECSGWRDPLGNHCVNPNKIPDYLSDLNAMHEAEKFLCDMQYTEYANKLSEMAYHLAHGHPHVVITRNTVSPSAAQRAEAFLRTINKWIDEQPQ